MPLMAIFLLFLSVDMIMNGWFHPFIVVGKCINGIIKIVTEKDSHQ